MGENHEGPRLRSEKDSHIQGQNEYIILQSNYKFCRDGLPYTKDHKPGQSGVGSFAVANPSASARPTFWMGHADSVYYGSGTNRSKSSNYQKISK